MVPDAPTLIVDVTVSESSLQKVFDACNNFPKSHAKIPVQEMELTKFHKLLRDLELVGPKLTTLDVDFILLKARPRGARKLSLHNFGVAVEMVAEKAGTTASELINKAIELGCPLPSAPPRREWKQISPHLMEKASYDKSCCDRLHCTQHRWRQGKDGTSPQEQRLIKQSAEWAQLREQREAARMRYAMRTAASGEEERIGRPKTAPKMGGRTTSLTSSGSHQEKGAAASDSKGARSAGRVSSLTASRSTPPIPERDGEVAEQDVRTPAGKQSALGAHGGDDSPVTPFVITDTHASTPSTGFSSTASSSFDTPESAKSQTCGLDLHGAFVVFCSLSPHKENEPKMSKSQPLMNMTEFRRLCRDCNLAPSAASEQPDITFHIVAKRSKTKFMDFDAFLYALERVALATHLTFADMESKIISTAETLKSEGCHIIL